MYSMCSHPTLCVQPTLLQSQEKKEKGIKINIPTLSSKTQYSGESGHFTGSLSLQTLRAALSLPREDQLRPFPHPCGLPC